MVQLFWWNVETCQLRSWSSDRGVRLSRPRPWSRCSRGQRFPHRKLLWIPKNLRSQSQYDLIQLDFILLILSRLLWHQEISLYYNICSKYCNISYMCLIEKTEVENFNWTLWSNSNFGSWLKIKICDIFTWTLNKLILCRLKYKNVNPFTIRPLIYLHLCIHFNLNVFDLITFFRPLNQLLLSQY